MAEMCPFLLANRRTALAVVSASVAALAVVLVVT
jgi:hypothetical protein